MAVIMTMIRDNKGESFSAGEIKRESRITVVPFIRRRRGTDGGKFPIEMEVMVPRELRLFASAFRRRPNEGSVPR